MKIYYRNKLLFKDIPKKEVEKIIDNYIIDENKKYDEIYNRTLNLMKKISKIRPRKSIELKAEYLEFLKTEYPEILYELEDIGKEFYKESFLKIFFDNSDCDLVGMYIKTEKYPYKQIFLNNILLEIAMKVPIKKLFEIKEED